MTHRFPVKEIARQAGVGPATVDRVLHARANVSPQTRARVLAAIAELEGQEAQLAARGRRLFIDVVVEAPRRFSAEVKRASEAVLPGIGVAVIRPRFLFQEVMEEAELLATLDRIARRGSHGVCLKARDLPGVRAAVDRLVAAGIPVVTLGMANDVDGNLAQVRELAEAVGEPQAGEALVGQIEAAIAAAAPPDGRAGPATILWQPGGIVPGDGALVVDLMRRVGLRPASATQGLGQGDRLPLEAVLVDPPELLLHAGPRGEEQSRALHHPALRKLGLRSAEFDPQLYYCGDPSLIRAARRLAQIRDEAA